MVKISFYAAARAAAGTSTDVVDAANLGELISHLGKKYPSIAPVLPGCSYLKNGVACRGVETSLKNFDQIDVLPRFAGG